MSLHNPISPLRAYYVQKVLPAVYDDSLSYYEILCKVQETLNEVVSTTNEQSVVVLEMQQAINDFIHGGYTDTFEEYLDEWFEENSDAFVQRLIDEGIIPEVADIQSDLETVHEDIIGLEAADTELDTKKVPYPLVDFTPSYGTSGQVLSTNADGTTDWQDPVIPSDQQAEQIITQWLNEHPEATTTVQDGSITSAKLSAALDSAIMQNRGFINETSVNDLNDATDVGFYAISSPVNVANMPTNDVGTLLVFGTFVYTKRGTQIFRGSAGQIYTRFYMTSGWTAWENIIPTLSVDTDAIVNGAVTNTKIHDGSITSAKLADTLDSALMQNRGFINESAVNDMNDATEVGFYVVSSYVNVANMPAAGVGTLLVYGTFEYTSRGTQIFMLSTGQIYTRFYTNSGWSTWENIIRPLSVDTGAIAEGAVTEDKLAGQLKSLIPYLKGIIAPSLINDLNNLKNAGMYVVADYNVQNIPLQNVGTLLVMGREQSNRTTQLFISVSGVMCWRGFSTSTQWSEWKTSDELFRYSNELVLPSKFDAASGTQYDIEFYNMGTMFDISQCKFTVTNMQNTADDKVWNMCEKIRVQRSTTGTRNLQISVTDSSGNIIAPAKTMTLNTVSTATKPTVKAIFIGDSLTEAGYYLAELLTLYGSNLTLVGTISKTAPNAENVNMTFLHEGHAGWSYNDLLTRYSYKDSTNSFYNPSTQQFDFSYYMAQNPTFAGVTDVFLFSGPNDGTNYAQFQTALAAICSSIKSYSASIRIHIMTPTPPIRNGYGFAKTNATNYLDFKAAMLTHAKHVINTYDGQSGYYVVPTHLCIDCWYDFAHVDVPVSSRNPTIVEEGNNNVHPNRYGYYKISDVVYGHILANCS